MPYLTAAARKQFDSWSWHYDWNLLQLCFFGPAHKMLLDALLPTDRQILDVGCGTGIFAARVLERHPEARLWGVDLSAGMVRQCRKRCQQAGGRLHLVQGDSERLPFPDSTFDVVTCTHSFHHYPRQERVADEMYRILRPEGRLLIIDGDPGSWWGKMVYDFLVVFLEGPVRHLTSAGFRELYAWAGFEHIHQKRRGGPLPFLLTVGSAAKEGATAGHRRAA